MLRVSKADHGTDDGRFQPGDPLNDRPPTRVSASWLNSIQEEIANVIIGRGISLDEKDEGQLLKAILDIYSYGISPVTYPILNGTTTPTDLPFSPLDKAKFKTVHFSALSIRHTTKADLSFFTSHVAVFNTYTSSWTLLTQFDPAIMKLEVQSGPNEPSSPPGTSPPIPNSVVKMSPGPHLLSISAGGKLQYQTSFLDGESHQGSLILSHFRYLRTG